MRWICVILVVAVALTGCSFAGGSVDYKGHGSAVLTVTEGRVEGPSTVAAAEGVSGGLESAFAAEARVQGRPEPAEEEPGHYMANAWYVKLSDLLVAVLLAFALF